MSKPEWEKTRDTMDFIAGNSGQASSGVFGAMGAAAHRARQSNAPNTPEQQPKPKQGAPRPVLDHGPRQDRPKELSVVATKPSARLPYWLRSLSETGFWTVLAVATIAGA